MLTDKSVLEGVTLAADDSAADGLEVDDAVGSDENVLVRTDENRVVNDSVAGKEEGVGEVDKKKGVFDFEGVVSLSYLQHVINRRLETLFDPFLNILELC